MKEKLWQFDEYQISSLMSSFSALKSLINENIQRGMNTVVDSHAFISLLFSIFQGQTHWPKVPEP